MRPKFYTKYTFDVPKRDHRLHNGDVVILTKCESIEKLQLLRGWWDDEGFRFRQKYQAAIFHEDLASMMYYLKAKSVAAASNGHIQSIVDKFESRHPDLVYDGGAGTALVNGVVFKLVDNSDQIVAKFLEGGGNFKRWIPVEEYHSLLESLLSQPSIQTIGHLCACEDSSFFDMNLFVTILFEIFRVGNFGVRPDEEVTKLLAECTAPDIGYWEKEIKILRDYLSDGDEHKFNRARRGTNLQEKGLPYNIYFGLARRDYAICDVPVTVYHYKYEYDKKKSAIPVVGIENFKHIWVTTLQRHCSTLSSPEKLKNFITNRMHTNAQRVFDIVFYKLRRDPAPPSVAVATDTMFPFVPVPPTMASVQSKFPPSTRVLRQTPGRPSSVLPSSVPATTQAIPHSDDVTERNQVHLSKVRDVHLPLVETCSKRTVSENTGLQSSIGFVDQHPPAPVETHSQNRFRRSTTRGPVDLIRFHELRNNEREEEKQVRSTEPMTNQAYVHLVRAYEMKIETDKDTFNKISEGIIRIHESEHKGDIYPASERERVLLSTAEVLDGGKCIAPRQLFHGNNEDTSTRHSYISKIADSSVTWSEEMTGKGVAVEDDHDISSDARSDDSEWVPSPPKATKLRVKVAKKPSKKVAKKHSKKVEKKSSKKVSTTNRRGVATNDDLDDLLDSSSDDSLWSLLKATKPGRVKGETKTSKKVSNSDGGVSSGHDVIDLVSKSSNDSDGSPPKATNPGKINEKSSEEVGCTFTGQDQQNNPIMDDTPGSEKSGDGSPPKATKPVHGKINEKSSEELSNHLIPEDTPSSEKSGDGSPPKAAKPGDGKIDEKSSEELGDHTSEDSGYGSPPKATVLRRDYVEYLAARMIQAHWRSSVCRKDCSTMYRRYCAARTIQKTWRSFDCRMNYLHFLANILIVQRTYRYLVQRAVAKQKSQAARLIQRAWRGFVCVTDSNEYKVARKIQAACSEYKRYNAATMIQSQWRGYLASEYKRYNSATMIQSQWRRLVHFADYQEYLTGIRKIQTVARRYIHLTAYRRYIAARNIQAAWRGHLKYAEFNRYSAVVTIQSLWRGFVHYADYAVRTIQTALRRFWSVSNFIITLDCSIQIQATPTTDDNGGEEIENCGWNWNSSDGLEDLSLS